MRWKLAARVLAVLALAPVALAAAPETLNQTLALGACEVASSLDGSTLTVPGLGRLLVPGAPKLPSRIYAVALPPGASVISVEAVPGPAQVMPGTWRIAPSVPPRPIGPQHSAFEARQQQQYQDNYDAIYGSDAVFPARMAEFVRMAGYRQYHLVDVRVTPFEYRPASGQLTYYPHLSICVHYRLPESPVTAVADALPRTERIAQQIILNYTEAQRWYPATAATGRGLHDYVIITLDALVSSVSSLANWETAKGRNVYTVTTSWINSNYTGYDLAEKTRNFLRDKYPAEQWGIEDVLLVGDYDSVPMRRTAQDVGYGAPETDYYYAELSLPDNQSWDSDGDHAWGEDTDPIDFYNEVNVGRIPWGDTTNVAHICEKSIAYEQNNTPSFKKNILLLGAYFWDDDPNPKTDNAVLMEAKVNQPWMADWTKTRMYEQGYSTYAMDYNLTFDNVRNVWSAGTYAFVNWAGHGSPTSAHAYHNGEPAFVTTTTCASLNDSYPAIVFADACSNSDTDELNLGQAMLQRGAVGFVGATKVALGQPGWTGPLDGSTQSLDYYFTTMVTTGDYTQGAAHQQAMRNMYTYGLWGYVAYETFEWGALWGNPNLGMSSPSALVIDLPDGAPGLLAPGVPTTFTVEIRNGLENYVPGSGLLHYRYDGGSYHSAALTSLSGNLYQATLPAAQCDDTPEYYLSALGSGGTAVYEPFNAPADVHTAQVGTIVVPFEDALETELGWTVGDTGDNATTGIWTRNVPQATIAQPGSDHTPTGMMCWVTDYRAGSSDGAYDVDGGKTTVKTPMLALAAYPNVTISYWRWYSNSAGGAPNADTFRVDISNNNGSTWVNVETVGPTGAEVSGGWYYHEFAVTTFVALTDQIKLRFIAEDASTGSLIEAAIDDFRVTAFDCTQPFGKGDMDCDGVVNNQDIDAFVQALFNPAQYAIDHPGCDILNGDMTGDGAMNNQDIDPFVDCLFTNNCP